MGQISKNDLLQLEMNVLEAQSVLTDNESSLKSQMFKLRSFLGLDTDEVLLPVLPDTLPPVTLLYDEVLGKALQNNSFSRNIRRRQLEADYEVAKAKGNRRKSVCLHKSGLQGLIPD